jgi:DNA-binding NarL/FixJ family response regulator
MNTFAASHLRERQSPYPVSLQPVEAKPRGDEARVSALLIDPRPLTRECLARWLETSSGAFRVTAVADPGEVGDGNRCGEADLVILNIGPATVADAQVAESVGLLRRSLPDVPIVLFAEREDVAQVAAAVRHGARGYIPSSLSPEVVHQALRLIQAGGIFVPASVVVQAAQQRQQAEPPAPREADKRFDGFTPRELEVLDRLRRGLSNKIIAYELDICDNTVKVHVKHIMRKLKTTNRTQAALLARSLFENGEIG